jgi:outer membrane protein TolC
VRAETLALAAVLAGCATLTRPEGNGGWSPARRHAELAERAAVAGVPFADTAATTPAAPSGPLTLDAAVALAASGNRRVAEAERRLAIAREQVSDTRGRLLPSTIGSGRYTWFSDAQTTGVQLPPSLLPPGVAPPVVTVREKEFGVANLSATVPLDVWGELRHALTASQAGYRGERARLWATTLTEEVLVVRSYFDLLEAERLREVSQQTLASTRQQLANAQSRFDSGRLTKNELLVVQVAVRNIEQELVRRELAIDQARWTLNETIGLPVDAPTDVVDVGTAPPIPTAEEALRLAQTSNPALVSLLEEQQRLDDVATSLARGRWPRLSAGGTLDYSSAEVVQPQRVESAFVGFNWDFGSDGRREAQIAAARLAADENRIATERELRELETAVRTAQRSVEERLSAYAVAQVAVGQADENLRIRRQQFDAGRATSNDVLDAEALLAVQRATRASALYQAHSRRAELQRLIGLPLDELIAAQR